MSCFLLLFAACPDRPTCDQRPPPFPCSITSASHVISDNYVYRAFENRRGLCVQEFKRTLQLASAIVHEVTEWAM